MLKHIKQAKTESLELHMMGVMVRKAAQFALFKQKVFLSLLYKACFLKLSLSLTG